MITYQERISYTKFSLRYMTIDDVIHIIKEGTLQLHDPEIGDYTLADAIRKIRSESDQQYWKARLLPAVAFNGNFRELVGHQLIDYSNITALDFDHLSCPEEMESLWKKLTTTPCVRNVFITPSGRGLKAIVEHDNTDRSKHPDLYAQLLKKFNVACSDASCKDIARRNYLSYDPSVWTNPNVVPFHYVPSTTPKVVSKPYTSQKRVSDKSILSMMNATWKKKHPEYWQEGNRATSIFKLSCLLCKWGVDEELAREYFVREWEDDSMSDKEIIGHVSNAYKTESKNFGSVEFEFHCNYEN